MADLAYLTDVENPEPAKVATDKLVDREAELYTLAIQRRTGKIVWRREAPRSRAQ